LGRQKLALALGRNRANRNYSQQAIALVDAIRFDRENEDGDAIALIHLCPWL